MQRMKVLVLLASMSAALLLGSGGTAGAAASCTAEQFTVAGVFDLQGYLACQSALAGGLPATGSNVMQIAGIALGLAVIGVAFLVSSYRKRPGQLAP